MLFQGPQDTLGDFEFPGIEPLEITFAKCPRLVNVLQQVDTSSVKELPPVFALHLDRIARFQSIGKGVPVDTEFPLAVELGVCSNHHNWTLKAQSPAIEQDLADEMRRSRKVEP